MPYIQKKDRKKFDRILDSMPPIATKGELEYCIYRLMLWFVPYKTYRYTTLHDAVYAAVHAAHEFERRYLDKREDEAIKENGDITI